MTVLVVTGTGTGVGKTVVTAALACHARQAGIDVAVCKPVQTGTQAGNGEGDDDLAEVARLSGVTQLAGLARYPQPLAPAAAAELAGMALPTRDRLLAFISDLDRPGRLTLVEGAGGLLVELGAAGVTLRDLAAELGAAALVGDVLVHSGDLLVADTDGVVVIARDAAARVVEAGVERERSEQEIVARLERGERTLDIYHLQ